MPEVREVTPLHSPGAHRVLVCGSRYWEGWTVMRNALRDVKPRPTAIIHGCAKGADSMAGWLARKAGVEELRFPADWKALGKRAGPLRNEQMLIEGCPHLVLAFHEHQSLGLGTADMVHRAREAGVPTRVFVMSESGRCPKCRAPLVLVQETDAVTTRAECAARCGHAVVWETGKPEPVVPPVKPALTEGAPVVTPKSCVDCGDPADRLCGTCGRRVCGDCREEHGC